ncbi:hypothetical protein Hanom_Chr03g00261131 [Helianthus anomalus]
MAPGKDNLSESVSVLTQRQLDKFVREYRIPLNLNPVLPSKDEIIYPFCTGKFPLYTRVCNFANYRVPFSKFLIRVLQFFRVHLCQGIPSCLSGDERSNLKNWKDNFFWLDDRCLSVEMVWRFKDQTLSFDLGEDFVFNQELALALIDNNSPIRPLPEHFLLLGRVCFTWGRGDRDSPVSRMKRERNEMSLRDTLKVPNFNVLDFDFDEHAEGEIPLMKQVSSSAQEIRPPVQEPISSEAPVVETTSVGSGSKGKAVGSSAVQARSDPDGEGADSDPDGVSLNIEPKGLVHRKRKVDAPQVRSSTSLPMPKLKKTKSSSHSSDNVITEIDEHLSGGKWSKEEAALARSAPTPAFSGGYLPVNEAENMEVKNPAILSKGDGEAQGGEKVVTFSGTILDSSLGPDCFIDDEEDQVSSLPPSWFGPGMSFFSICRCVCG